MHSSIFVLGLLSETVAFVCVYEIPPTFKKN